jgi:hypothetical protein
MLWASVHYSSIINIHILMVIVKVLVLFALASCGFVADTDVLDEHTDSIFRVDVYRFRNRLFTSSP